MTREEKLFRQLNCITLKENYKKRPRYCGLNHRYFCGDQYLWQ